ncbi:MAG: hypothetical protein JST92_21760, partial [Deltaproteobacteria bacterium]|nr:hypothetical protein [Deltaproteobacteria bacterium]
MSSLLAAPALAMLVASCGGTPTGNDKGFATRSRDTLSPITLPGTVGKGAAIKTACHQLSGGNCTPTQIQTVAGAVTMLNLTPTSTPPVVQSWTSSKPLAWTDPTNIDAGQYSSSSSTFGNMVGIFAAGTLVHHSPWSFSGYINVGAASTRSFTVGSDDGFMLAISNGSTVVTSTKDAPRSFGYGDSSAQTWSTVTFPSAGLYPFEIIYYENEGQEGVQFIAASGTPSGLPGSGLGGLHGWGIVPASMVYAPDVSATLAWTNGSSTSTTAVVGTGTVIKYAATVTNNGTVPTPSTLTYTVSLPTATFSAASATAPCTSSTVGANFVVTCTMSALGVGASTTLNYQATLGTASNGQVIDTQGVVTGLSTAPEIAAAVGDTVGMYIYTTSTQTGGAATSTNTGN